MSVSLTFVHIRQWVDAAYRRTFPSRNCRLFDHGVYLPIQHNTSNTQSNRQYRHHYLSDSIHTQPDLPSHTNAFACIETGVISPVNGASSPTFPIRRACRYPSPSNRPTCSALYQSITRSSWGLRTRSSFLCGDIPSPSRLKRRSGSFDRLVHITFRGVTEIEQFLARSRIDGGKGLFGG